MSDSDEISLPEISDPQNLTQEDIDRITEVIDRFVAFWTGVRDAIVQWINDFARALRHTAESNPEFARVLVNLLQDKLNATREVKERKALTAGLKEAKKWLSRSLELQEQRSEMDDDVAEVIYS